MIALPADEEFSKKINVEFRLRVGAFEELLPDANRNVSRTCPPLTLMAVTLLAPNVAVLFGTAAGDQLAAVLKALLPGLSNQFAFPWPYALSGASAAAARTAAAK